MYLSIHLSNYTCFSKVQNVRKELVNISFLYYSFPHLIVNFFYLIFNKRLNKTFTMNQIHSLQQHSCFTHSNITPLRICVATNNVIIRIVGGWNSMEQKWWWLKNQIYVSVIWWFTMHIKCRSHTNPILIELYLTQLSLQSPFGTFNVIWRFECNQLLCD